MNYTIKGKAKYISASLAVVLLIAMVIVSAKTPTISSTFYKTLTADTIPAGKGKPQLKAKSKKPASRVNVKDSAVVIKTDSAAIIKNDTVPVPQLTAGKPGDTATVTTIQKIDSFDVKMSKDSLDAPVTYHADDSMVMYVPEEKIILYGKTSSVTYQDNVMKAPGITFDQKTNLVTAYHTKDSTGKVTASPSLKQAEMLVVSDSINFNMKTGKGLTKGTYTQQGEMYIYGERMKKQDANVFYAYKARLTTCNLDTPHFAFVSKKIKFINKKFAVTGPVHPEFEGIPIPVVIPFGIYPLSEGRHSGLIAPQFTTNAQFGLALEGLGYYKVLNDNWDVTARGTLYSYGGWTTSFASRYYKRYHYNGNLVLDIQHTKYNFKGDPDYQVSNSFNIRWTHSSDSKARPGVTFSGNVNAGSSSFNQFVPNSPTRNFQNQLQSSIQYSKVWKDKPFNMSVVANHNQNTNSKTINVTLPDLSFNVNTLYPFRRKEAVGQLKWYENIGIALNTNVKNQTTFTDSATKNRKSIFEQAANNLQYGATHSIPISLSLPALGPLQLSPGVSYAERWYQQRLVQRWNDTLKKRDSSLTKGFYAARQMAFSLSASTRIFGMFGFGKNSNIKAIRHELRPQISASYSPDMNRRYFYTTQVDTNGRKERLSLFSSNTIASPFGEGRFGGLTFSLDNILQMKVKDKKDTAAEATKKVTLIDGLNIGGSYNFLAKSFPVSYLNMSVRTNLFDKFNITGSATFDPYQDSLGTRSQRLVWKDKIFTLGRLTNASLSVSSQFQGGDPKKAKQKKDNLSNSVNPYTGIPLTEEQAEAAYISNNPAEFADFSIPWSVNFGYSLRLSPGTYDRLRKKYPFTISSDINLSGTLSLSPKWQIGFNGIFNFTTGQAGLMSFSISREMHCWQMSISVAPVGRNRFFSVIISPKSALLRDIKVNRTRQFFDL